MEDAAGNRTTFTYDETTGRKTAATNALGRTTRYAYNIRGQVLDTWPDNVSGDTTAWAYDTSTGLAGIKDRCRVKRGCLYL